MKYYSQFNGTEEMIKIVLVFIIGIIEIPLVIGLNNQNTPGQIIGLVTSIIILQPLAAVVGLGLGIYPIQILLIMVSFGISVVYMLFGICDIFAGRSEWLQQHIKKIETITQKSKMFRKYGIYAFIPFIWVPGIGLYGCVIISWLFKWRSARAAAIILAGWILAILIVLLTSMGIFTIIL
jgi:uncharacterized membrane protein